MMRNIAVITLIGCLNFFNLQAQENSVVTELSRFIQNSHTLNRIYPQEKVYVHLDNTGYFLNETIWFKAYVVTPEQHKATNLSVVLYVELLNANGILLETKKVKIENGQGQGDFFLTPYKTDYLPGFYEIRAYTKTMLNWDNDMIFSRVFPVFNKLQEEGNYTEMNMKTPLFVFTSPEIHRTFPDTKKQRKINISFYPEGGNLVNGLKSKVAFKATDENGKSLNINGIVCKNNEVILTPFSTLHNGMGFFEYTPTGKRGKVKIDYENKEYTFNLPAGTPWGYVMEVNHARSRSISIRIEKSANLPSQPLGLSIACRGKFYYFHTVEPGENGLELEISTDSLPAGVNQITLFDSLGEIYAERLLFIYPKEEEKLYVQTSGVKNEYMPHEQINLQFSITNYSGRIFPKQGFSLSIRDAATSFDKGNLENIYTYLLLSSDLKGYIENPDYYFESNDIERQLSLDVLMLVQGWRRYEWKEMTGIAPWVQKYPVEKNISLKGVAPIYNNTPVQVNFIFNRDTIDIKGAQMTDKKGNFAIELPYPIYGKWYLYIQHKNSKKQNEPVRLDRWFSPPPKPYTIYETDTENRKMKWDIHHKYTANDSSITKIQSPIDTIQRAYLIPEVKVYTLKGKDIVHDVETEIGKLIDNGKKIPANQTLYHYLKQKFPQRYFISENPDYDFKKISIFQVEQVSVSEWEKKQTPVIVYFNPTYHAEWYPHIRYTNFYGYSVIKEFFHPDYQHRNVTDDEPDFRRTLYWNPNVQTDSTGKAEISFYNNSFCKQIEISAAGITDDGIPFQEKNRLLVP